MANGTQTMMLEATRHMEKHLKTNHDVDGAEKTEKWRTSANLFQPGEEWTSGTLSFSAGWFAQGHVVSA